MEDTERYVHTIIQENPELHHCLDSYEIVEVEPGFPQINFFLRKGYCAHGKLQYPSISTCIGPGRKIYLVHEQDARNFQPGQPHGYGTVSFILQDSKGHPYICTSTHGICKDLKEQVFIVSDDKRKWVVGHSKETYFSLDGDLTLIEVPEEYIKYVTTTVPCPGHETGVTIIGTYRKKDIAKKLVSCTAVQAYGASSAYLSGFIDEAHFFLKDLGISEAILICMKTQPGDSGAVVTSVMDLNQTHPTVRALGTVLGKFEERRSGPSSSRTSTCYSSHMTTLLPVDIPIANFQKRNPTLYFPDKTGLKFTFTPPQFNNNSQDTTT